ncbi:MAG TPA: hypothetical protein VIQ77_08650 [Mucilaginibacter sp.]|jgi:hypothetical protein
MKKFILLITMILPVIVHAQSAWTLKHQADSLRKHGKEKKAAKIYQKAIDKVLNYQERITDVQWLMLSLAAHDNQFNIDKKIFPFPCQEYGNHSIRLKEKIIELSSQNAQCIYTYDEWLSMTGTTMMTPDSVSGEKIGFPYKEKILLVWVMKNNVYFQEFNSSNVYRPLTIHNDTLRNLLVNHGSKMAHEALNKEHPKYSETPKFTFKFYSGVEQLTHVLNDPQYLIDPEVNSKSYLSKLRPLMWRESRLYHERAIKGS